VTGVTTTAERPVLDPTPTGWDHGCQLVEQGEAWPCGAPHVAVAVITCGRGHDESVRLCGRHLLEACSGGVACYDCDPPTRAWVAAVLPR
jgi:hypothetical protein